MNQPGQFFEGLEPYREESMQKILVSMMDPDKIETKTQIQVPQALAQLWTLATILGDRGFKELESWIYKYIDKYLVYQVSLDRMGRKEVFAAITEALREERKMHEKLTSSPTEE